MNIVTNKKSIYKIVKDEPRRIIVCWGKEDIKEPVLDINGDPTDECKDTDLCTWRQQIYHKYNPLPPFYKIKQMILDDVNATTTHKIIKGFEWQGRQVWLSTENQINYKTAFDLAVQTDGDTLPYTIKVGAEDAPKYITFNTLVEFKEFYTAMVTHIQNCQKEAWDKKGNIDWDAYEEALKELYHAKE